MNLLELADAIAAEAHRGQLDKSGAPYIDHPRAVARLLAMEGADEKTLAAALLHDVLEDTPVSASELRFRGVPDAVVDDVIALTFRYFDANETRAEYYERVKLRSRALVVKRADVAHNAGRIHALCDPDVRARLEHKYEKARHALA